MHKRLRSIHRAVSLAFLVFWLVQAASGLFLVFHREIDAARHGAASARPFDIDAVSGKVERLAEDGRVGGLFAVTGYSALFDVHLSDAGEAWVVRIDGSGAELERRPFGDIFLTVNRLHRNLLVGPPGAWLLSISGVLLISNLLIGLRLAWPRRGQWRRALLPRTGGAAAARFHGWHRAAGLWVAPLALVTLSCGVALQFEREIMQLTGAAGDMPPPAAATGAGPPVQPAVAIRNAMNLYPGAELTGLQMPTDGTPLFRVFLRQPAEPDQAHGATRVFIEASTGQPVGAYDPLRAVATDRFASLLYPVHTGQVGGLVGRIAALGVGLWLVTMIILGTLLWRSRRRSTPRRAPKTEARES